MAAQTARGVPLSTLSPKFLHTNSTSHTWPFSAIAELIDNAYDPDVSANQFWIDRTVVKGHQCLTFIDNGNGLDFETMHKMLSFGYSDKTAVNGIVPIGTYGNGFKSGSMRLGSDAIVFSRSKNSSCVGMLSQTYLKEIEAKQIVVPIISIKKKEKNSFSVQEGHKASLQAILCYSPFTTQGELLTELNAISPLWCLGKTGTRIIIWNLRRTTTGMGEFDFEKDRYDIQIPSDVYETVSNPQHSDKVTSYVPESVYSLRAYCSILYLKPRMQVIIRGQKVKTQLIAKSLACIRKDHYKPTFLTRRVPIIFGYNTKSKDQYGIMMYHKNRLIKAYERVGCQLKANTQGVGVIGVIECNFLDPTHNKQSFNETDKYRKTMNNLGIKLDEYSKEIRYRWSKVNPNSTTPLEDAMKRPDQIWVQCDDCLRWRKLPDGIDYSKLPDKWYCWMNPDPQFRSCQVDEEPEDSDDDQPSYCKTYKQQEKEERKQQEQKRQKDEELRQRKEVKRLANLTKQNKALRKQQEDLKRQLHSKTVCTPPTPTTTRSRFNAESQQGGAARAELTPTSETSSTISQAACSPSSNDGLPVITNVCSLSADTLSGLKRPQTDTPKRTLKRPRVNGSDRSSSDAPSLVEVSSRCSTPVPADDEDDTDDDIFILENASTPKPKQLCVDPAKGDAKQELSDENVVLLECSGDDAADVSSETNAAGTSSPVRTSPIPTPPPGLTSVTTQTEARSVKKEEEGGTGPCTSNTVNSHVNINVCGTDQRVIKLESGKDAPSDSRVEITLQSGATDRLEDDGAVGPSCAGAGDEMLSNPHQLNIIKVQEQQDQLLELMQTTAEERDSLKDEVYRLKCQLHDMQRELQELSWIGIKKECSHQATQTGETEEMKGRNGDRGLFEESRQKVDELTMDRGTDPKTSIGQVKVKDTDEIALQVDYLMQELDQRNKEKDELRSQLDSVEEERANLAAQCEDLRLSLQNAQGGAHQRATDSSAQPKEAEGTATSSAHSNSDTFRSLLELRQNIGRLLITFVPALDLGQVNFECNVIDEILEQVLSEPAEAGTPHKK